MNKHLPTHLTQEELLSEDQASEIMDRTAKVLDESVVPFIVTAQQVMESAFLEWRGEGKYIYTPDGKGFFDCVGAGGVFGLGFAHPEVVDAVVRQAQRGGLATRAGFLPGQAELAEKLKSVAPDHLEYVYFGNSGTEAVEAAIKLARVSTGKKKLIGTHLGYHGMSIATISLSGIGMWRDGIGPYLDSTVLVEHGNLADLEEAIDDDTAAVVLEPVQWASGCKVVSQEYFQGVRELCDRHGAMLILDEVQTGLGRTGKRFALEHWGVKPDILCTGKILSGGMVPVSAVLYTAEAHKGERMRPLFNNSSFGGNPLACAAGITTLNLLKDRYFERAEKLGDLMGEAFQELVQEFGYFLAGFHGLGLMRCLEFQSPLFGAVFAEWMRRDESILVAAMGHVPQFVRISPPFICEDEDIEALKQSCRKVLRTMAGYTPQELFEDFSSKLQRVQRAMAEKAERAEEQEGAMA
ncbi:MAG: aspartate aminotransferase family protein [Vulcanimicrobiota bacterium]